MRIQRFITGLLASTMLFAGVAAANLSDSLVLPADQNWQRSLQQVLRRQATYAQQQGHAPVIELLEVGVPGQGRLVGRASFNKPLDFTQSTLNIYLDLDNDPATGREDSSHRGVDVMLTFASGQARIAYFNPEYEMGPTAFKSVVEGKEVWFTVTLPDHAAPSAIRLYTLSQQSGLRSDTIPQQTQVAVKMGDLKIKPLVKPSANKNSFVLGKLPEVAWSHIPEQIREELALPDKGEGIKEIFNATSVGGNPNTAPFVRRWSGAHLGEDRLFFQIDFDRSIPLSGSTFIIYLDTDDNADTGRTDKDHRGVDLMVVAGNNSLVLHPRNNDLSPSSVRGRGRSEANSLYLIIEVPLLNKQNGELKLRGYGTSQATGSGTVSTGHQQFSFKEVSAKPKPFPALSQGDMLSREGYRYIGNKVAYESFANKGNHYTDIRKTPFTVGRERPVPVFHARGKKDQTWSGDLLRIPVEVKEEAGVARQQGVVRWGLPLPKGKVFQPDLIRVEREGQALKSQAQVTAFWPDGSIKWAAVDFRDSFEANQVKHYEVVVGKAGDKEKSGSLRVVEDPKVIGVETGVLRATINRENYNGLQAVWVSKEEGWEPLLYSPQGFVITDAEGTVYSSANVAPSSVDFEENTPQRVTIRIRGDYASTEGKRYMSYVSRLTFHAGSGRVDLAHTHINTWLETEFTEFESIGFDLRVQGDIKSASVMTGAEQDELTFVQGKEVALVQETDQQAVIHADGKSQHAERTPGAVYVKTSRGNVTMAVTDFWQRWPKGIAVDAETISLQLLPKLPSAEFGKDLPYYLMFPFVDGYYRLKWGMSFTERVVFDFSGKAEPEEVWAETQWPLIAVIPAQWYADSKAFIKMAVPRGDQFSMWDNYMENTLEAHLRRKDGAREYGFINYGDWFGERGRNWGNNEYDLPHTLFSHFARTGNRDFYRYGLRGARHQADVDIVHAYPDAYFVGANHQHSIGHTGQWSERPPNATWSFVYNVATWAGNGHTWADGMVNAWLIATDSVVMDSALKLGEHISFAFAPDFKQLGNHERSAGWSMRAAMALYRATSDPVYLETAKRIGDVALSEQDLEKTGVWPHELPAGHAAGRTGLWGNNVYLIGVLLGGLQSYHEYTGDERYETSIKKAGKWLSINWDPNTGGWPYSVTTENEPAAGIALALNPLIHSALLYAAILSEEEVMVDQAERAMVSLFGAGGADADGKTFSFKGFFTAETLGRLQKWYERKGKADYPFLSSSQDALSNYLNDIPVAQEFSVRAPDEKEFRVVTEGATTINILRRSFGSLPKRFNTGNYEVIGENGSVLVKKEFSTDRDLSDEVQIPAAGTWQIKVHDDQRGVWSASSDQAKVYSVAIPGYRIGGAARKRLLFEVPEETTEFTVEVNGVHIGTYGAAVLDPDGQLLGYYLGANETMHLVTPGLKVDRNQYSSAYHDLKVEVPDNVSKGKWSLLFWGAGDIGIQLQGIPPWLSIQSD